MQGLLEILGRVGFNWQIALANLANFLIVFYLLNRFIFSKLRKTIDERERRIAQGLDDAAQAEESLRKAKEAGDSVIREAHREAGAIIQSAHDQGKNIVAEATDKSKEEAAGILAAASVEIGRRERQMEERVREQTINAAIVAAESLLKESIDKHKSEKIAKEAIAAK